MRAKLLGGPFDGGDIAPRRDAFVYIAGEGKFRGFQTDGPGRELYRRMHDHLFLYAGHTHRRCRDCGTWLDRREASGRCLCGRAVV